MKKDENKIITFFMLVTNEDILLADYTIKSYQKIYELKSMWGGENFVLCIYANCLKQENKDKYFPIWRLYPYVQIFDNIEKVQNLDLKYGEKVRTPEGVLSFREGNREKPGEVWTDELKKIQTPYYATVDADFEILHTNFYLKMMDELSQTKNLAAYAADYDPTSVVFESYSNDTVILSERWHTWFCIYKKEAQKCTTSHFYYEFILPNKMRFAYDEAAYHQYHLKEKHGYELKALPSHSYYQRQYIHYGAFAKNRSINEKNIFLYRYLSIKAHCGFSYSDPCSWRKLFLVRLLNLVYRKIASFLLYRIYSKHIEERRHYTPPPEDE